jgi:uncharacterized DUF497 family protein
MEFDWDEGNLHKLNIINAERGITRAEIESVFLDPNRVECKSKHQEEERFETVGLSNRNRLIFVVYTKRGNKIRYVTAWKQSKR